MGTSARASERSCRQLEKRGCTCCKKERKMAPSADDIKKVCDIYDWDGKGELDMFSLGDIVYALGFNITKKIMVGLGQTDEDDKNENGTMMLAELENILSNLADEIPKEDTQELL